MKIEQLDVPGAWVCTPEVFTDDRGAFLEWFRDDKLAAETGRRFNVAQANHSVSRRGALRGLHFADVPPGQAKYVYCPRGVALDVVVDIRVGSPTFGAVSTVQLDEQDRRGIFLAEGLGHAFLALIDDTAVTYLTSSPYNPTAEHTVNPLDPALALPWPDDVAPVLSPRDAAAPSLDAARSAGVLPSYDVCTAFYATL